MAAFAALMLQAGAPVDDAPASPGPTETEPLDRDSGSVAGAPGTPTRSADAATAPGPVPGSGSDQQGSKADRPVAWGAVAAATPRTPAPDAASPVAPPASLAGAGTDAVTTTGAPVELAPVTDAGAPADALDGIPSGAGSPAATTIGGTPTTPGRDGAADGVLHETAPDALGAPRTEDSGVDHPTGAETPRSVNRITTAHQSRPAGEPEAPDATAPEPVFAALADAKTGVPDEDEPVVVAASSGPVRSVGLSPTPHVAPQPAAAPVARPGFAPAGRDVSPEPVVVPPSPTEQLVALVAPLRDRADGSYRVMLELHPRELGQVDVELHVTRGAVHVTMHAEHGSTGALLREHLTDLRDQLDREGVRAGQLNVDTGGADTTGRRSLDPETGVGASVHSLDVEADPEPRPAFVTSSRSDSGLDVRL